jgi:hypothetical protein
MKYLVYTSIGPLTKLHGEFDKEEEALNLLFEMINSFPFIAENIKKKHNLTDNDLVWEEESDTCWSTGKGLVKLFYIQSDEYKNN